MFWENWLIYPLETYRNLKSISDWIKRISLPRRDTIIGTLHFGLPPVTHLQHPPTTSTRRHASSRSLHTWIWGVHTSTHPHLTPLIHYTTCKQNGGCHATFTPHQPLTTDNTSAHYLPTPSNTSLRTHIHTTYTTRAILSFRPNSLLGTRPPPVASSEAVLPRPDRVHLSRLRCGHHPSLPSYMHRIGRAASDLCNFCSLAPGSVSHFLLHCPSLTLHRASTPHTLTGPTVGRTLGTVLPSWGTLRSFRSTHTPHSVPGGKKPGAALGRPPARRGGEGGKTTTTTR